MQYYDQHLHTYFSFDSEELFEHYLINQPQYFVSTDHFDLNNPTSNGQDDIPNYPAYIKKLNQLEEINSTIFLKGIEIGVVPGQEQRIVDYLSSTPL